MENNVLTLNLPYKVKMVKKFINFSIIIILNEKIEKLKNILSYLEEFRDNNGEIIILNINNDEESIDYAKQFGCRIEDGTNFYRVIDDEMSKIINEKFNFDNKEELSIVKDGDNYIDYSGVRNYAASLASNNMVFMIDINCDNINFNIDKLQNYINDEYDLIEFNITKKKSHVYGFYNRNKLNWKNIIFEELFQIQEIKTIKCDKDILNISVFKKYSKDGTIKKLNIDFLIESLSINCFLDLSNEVLSQKFAIELFNKGFLESSFHEFNRHLSLCTDNVKRMKSLVYIGDYFINSGNDNNGIEYYHKALAECCLRRLPSYKLGVYYFLRNERQKSIFYLEGCLSIPKTDDIDEDNDEIFMYKDGPYSMLYVNYWWINDKKNGKLYFDKAIEINKYNKLYINEAIFHYDYISNDIWGPHSFQELQFLYNDSKKYKSVLEIYPPSARGTHALINGCNGIVTVILNDDERNQEFKEKLEYPGNFKIINVPNTNIIEYLNSQNEKYDMIVINDFLENILSLEFLANKIICGIDYKTHKNIIDNTFEITGVFDNLWYKFTSTFEKTITYKKKNNFD